LTEPFGLTLIEAAASGLPIIATEDGGPSDIIKNCQNGQLINPLDTKAMADALLEVLQNKGQWKKFSTNGIKRVAKHYSWQSHVEKYLDVVGALAEKSVPIVRMTPVRRAGVFRDRALFTSLDLNLIGDPESLANLLQILRSNRKLVIFGIATGRRLENALATLRQHQIPMPDVLITGQGSEIHYAPGLTKDIAWTRHINHMWNPQAVRDLLHEVAGLAPQPNSEQSDFQLSYYIDTNIISIKEIRQLLSRNETAVNMVHSFGQFLDILPARASKGLALRWCAEHLDFPLENTLVSGVTSADADMLIGNTLGTVIESRHREELSKLVGSENVFFSNSSYAAGIVEAMNYYAFPQMKDQVDETIATVH